VTHLRRLALAAAVCAAAGASTAAAADAPPPAGDPDGIALAQAVNRSYSAPARLDLEIVARFANGTRRERLVLAHGRTRIVVGSWTDERGTERNITDARGSFGRAAGERCWTRDGPGGPGGSSPLITLRGSTFHPPERFGAVTRLTVLERIRGSRRHLWVSYRIDSATERILTRTFYDLVVRYGTLPSPPPIPDPTPRCR